MVRIFSVLAVLAVVLLSANFLVGLWAGDFNAAAQAKQTAQQRFVKLQSELRLSRQKDFDRIGAGPRRVRCC